MASEIFKRAKRGRDALINQLFPPRCFACGELAQDHGNLCAECWSVMDFIAPPFCDCCGEPFEYHLKDATRCMACLLEPPPFTTARAVFRYSDVSRKLITGYKYHDRTHATPMFVRWLKRAGEGVIQDAELLIPVPLHPRRLLKRRYNQAALLARKLGHETGKPTLVDGLIRTRHTQQQAGLNREERAQNVQGVFVVNAKKIHHIQGKRIVLVDDVMTTGATVRACAIALREAGAADVSILTLARTTLPD